MSRSSRGAPDGASFTINKQTVRLLDFIYLYKASIRQVSQRVQQVMLGWRPRVDLSAIKDSLTCYTANWSFVQEEDNGLHLAYKASLGMLGHPRQLA